MTTLRAAQPAPSSCLNVGRPSRRLQARYSEAVARHPLDGGTAAWSRLRPAHATTNGNTPEAPPHHNVAIVGGGPAGLLAARALREVLPEADIKVYEAAAGYRPQGAGVLIDINGWRALHAVNAALAERLRSRGLLLGVTENYDGKGVQLPPMPFLLWDHEKSVQEHGHTRVLLQWGDIREELFNALPQGTVSFGRRLVDLTPGELGGPPAVLTFEASGGRQDATGNGNGNGDGATSADPVRSTATADLVVAADGFYSRCKRLAFGASGPPLLPTFRERVVWRALLTYPDADQVPQFLQEVDDKAAALMYFEGGMPNKRTAVVYPMGQGRFVWTCIASSADIEAAGLAPYSPVKGGSQDLGSQEAGSAGFVPKERCLAVFADFAPDLVDMITRTDPRDVLEHGYYAHEAETAEGLRDWVRGNVLAIGDAAHTAPPDGQGLNMALEDAAVLAAAIKAKGGICQEALEVYCGARLPRVRDVFSGTVMARPNRLAAVLGAAFEPLGPDSSGIELTGPRPVQSVA